MLSKNANNKKCAPKFILLDESFVRFLTLQILALFDTSTLHQFAKFNDFLWLQLIFSQKPF